MATERETRHCSSCGRAADAAAGAAPMGWSFTVEGKRVSYLCDGCARANLRAIEAKLPNEYWE